MTITKRVVTLLILLTFLTGVMPCFADEDDDSYATQLEYCKERGEHLYLDAYGWCMMCGTFIPELAKTEFDQIYQAIACVQNTLASPRSMRVEKILFNGSDFTYYTFSEDDESAFKNTTYIEYYYKNEYGVEMKEEAIVVIDLIKYSIKKQGKSAYYDLLDDLKQTGHEVSKLNLFLYNMKLRSGTYDTSYLWESSK